jgi:hypothetical protein
MIVDRILQNALKQHRQLNQAYQRISPPIEHRVLHDVERRVLVARGEHRLLEGTPLDLGEKPRHVLMRSQFERSGREIIRL